MLHPVDILAVGISISPATPKNLTSMSNSGPLRPVIKKNNAIL